MEVKPGLHLKAKRQASDWDIWGPCLQDAKPGTPIFVFLSPGVDVAASVEALGRKNGFTADVGKYASVSLGQGQEPIAMQRLLVSH